MIEVLIGLGLLAAVISVVSVPFWRPESETEDPVIAELEARKEHKYREIRDLELDYAAGKIGTAEFDRQRESLRAEAIEILERLDTARTA